MTAAILPLSPQIPDVHVMLSGPSGAPCWATRPVTCPDAQPTARIMMKPSTSAFPADARVTATLLAPLFLSAASLSTRDPAAPWDLGLIYVPLDGYPLDSEGRGR